MQNQFQSPQSSMLLQAAHFCCINYSLCLFFPVTSPPQSLSKHLVPFQDWDKGSTPWGNHSCHPLLPCSIFNSTIRAPTVPNSDNYHLTLNPLWWRACLGNSSWLKASWKQELSHLCPLNRSLLTSEWKAVPMPLDHSLSTSWHNHCAHERNIYLDTSRNQT